MDEIELANVYEIRCRNLEILIDGAGSVKELGEAMRRTMQKKDPDAAGKDYANTISQYRGGKPMGAQFARDLESSVGKPKNWMDVMQPDPAEQTVIGREAAQIVVGLDGESQNAAMKVLRALRAHGPKGPGNPYSRKLPK